MHKELLVIVLTALLFVVLGCNRTESPETQRSNLTAGMAKMNVVKGQTTQTEILEVFGPPDLVTHRDNLQVWTYDKIRYDIQTSGSYLTVLLAGTQGSRIQSSSTSTMLIIYFNNKDIVKDYRLNVTRF